MTRVAKALSLPRRSKMRNRVTRLLRHSLLHCLPNAAYVHDTEDAFEVWSGDRSLTSVLTLKVEVVLS